MKSLDQIFDADGCLLAMIIRSDFKGEGLSFLTMPGESLQVAHMTHPKGHVIKAHSHNLVERRIVGTQEVLFVKKGIVAVDFFDEANCLVCQRVSREGDVLVLLHGGHGFVMLEEAEIIEVKQGPYLGSRDKRLIEERQDGSIPKT